MNFLFTITDKFSEEVCGLYSSLMPYERRSRFLQCRDPLCKKQNVAAYMLLCYALNRAFGSDGVRLGFDYSPAGKPALRGCGEKFFSLSHSEEYVLCSVDGAAVGADIQKISSDGDSEGINLSIYESLYKLKEDFNASGRTNAIIDTKYKVSGGCVISVSSPKKADIDITEVTFDELINFFNARTTIGGYLSLNEFANSFTVKQTPLEMFRKNVALHGGREAVSFRGRSITYKQLDEYSDVLAARLIKVGAKVGGAVLLSIGAGIEFSIAQFAIMKAGCAYVPAYSRWPLERVNYILRHCDIKIAVFDGGRQFYDCNAEHKIICENYEGQKAAPVNVDERADDVCYIIYTSGSTGEPKGVMVTKSNLASFSYNKKGTYYRELVKADYARVACICPISFDMSVAENTTTLLNGGTVIFAGDEEQYPENFGKFILDNNVEVIWATPSKFKMYLQSESCKEGLSKIKLAVLAGEVLDLETARLSSAFPFRLYNTYGPTETTIISTYYPVTGADKDLPIGKPFAGEACFVVDNGGRLCEVGEKGELLISGKCVAAGYKNNKVQTEDRFLRNPFGSGTAYRTGDIVSLERDGLHFYGRKDNQVKVHGFRVELEEIESAIYKFTGKKTVVYCHEGRLAAFVESEEGIRNLSRGLKKILPDYMIPVVIYYVNKFPLNNNGKTDKKALISLMGNTAPTEYVAPQTEAERLMADCWSKYLNGVKVGVNDDFYQLGGDSIRALRIASELRAQNVEVTMFDIMNAKTISALLRELETRRKESVTLTASIDPSICAPEDAEVSLKPYIDYQGNFNPRNILREYEPLKMNKSVMDSSLGCNRVIYSVSGTKNKDAVLNALRQLIKNNAAFRTVYNRGSGRCEQYGYSDDWYIPVFKTAAVNRRFLNDSPRVNLKDGRQYLSYVFLAEDSGGALYIAIIIHWRFFDRAAAQLVRRQLIAALNGEKINVVGITDPAEYARLVRSGAFDGEVIPNDIAEELSEFAALAGDGRFNDELKAVKCSGYYCFISFSRSVYEDYNNNPLNFIIDIFADVLLAAFKRQKLPVYIVDQNRSAVNKDLLDTVIDFLPLVVGGGKYDYYKYIKKLLAVKPAGESFIECGGWNAGEKLLPFLNYVSVLDERDSTDIEIFEKAKIDIGYGKQENNEVSCSAFVRDGKLRLYFSLPEGMDDVVKSVVEKKIDIK